MKSKYIIINRYYKVYIKEDMTSFLLYFNYFSDGLFLPKYLSSAFMKRYIHSLLRYAVLLMYFFKIYKLLCKSTLLNDNALIIVEGQGTNGNIIKLVKENGKLAIVKKITNNHIYEKEKEFYNSYRHTTGKILLPTHRFLGDNIIKIDFIGEPSIQRKINDGNYTFDDALKHYHIIKSELKGFYKKSNGLIHGDLYLANMYFKGDTYFLIDYSDSHINSYHYDLYTMLFSILASFHYIPITAKTIKNVAINNTFPKELLGINENEYKRIENKFIKWRHIKFPNVYSL